MFKIIKRLDPKATYNRLPPKPKGMHWRSYQRLADRYHSYGTKWALAIARRFRIRIWEPISASGCPTCAPRTPDRQRGLSGGTRYSLVKALADAKLGKRDDDVADIAELLPAGQILDGLVPDDPPALAKRRNRLVQRGLGVRGWAPTREIFAV
jgi:hypothetical protein